MFRPSNAVMSVVVVIIGVHTLVISCSPHAQREVQLTVDDASHLAAIKKCTADAKLEPEGMQWAAFCACWHKTNAKYGVDAGECTR
jgi:hypothetical protein